MSSVDLIELFSVAIQPAFVSDAHVAELRERAFEVGGDGGCCAGGSVHECVGVLRLRERPVECGLVDQDAAEDRLELRVVGRADDERPRLAVRGLDRERAADRELVLGRPFRVDDRAVAEVGEDGVGAVLPGEAVDAADRAAVDAVDGNGAAEDAGLVAVDGRDGRDARDGGKRSSGGRVEVFGACPAGRGDDVVALHLAIQVIGG